MFGYVLDTISSYVKPLLPGSSSPEKDSKKWLEDGYIECHTDEEYKQKANQFIEFHFKNKTLKTKKCLNVPIRIRNDVFDFVEPLWKDRGIIIYKHGEGFIYIVDPFSRNSHVTKH